MLLIRPTPTGVNEALCYPVKELQYNAHHILEMRAASGFALVSHTLST